MKYLTWCKQLAALVVSCVLVLPLAGAATTSYVYDEVGRLVQATRSDGVVIQYVYDANGNMLAVNRSNGSALTISTFSPTVTHSTATVVIAGTGFSTVSADNTVTVGGAVANVVSAGSTQLVITVPMAAQSGVVSVTVGANTALSVQQITVRKPAITDFAPKVINVGGTVSITGNYFTLMPGTTFTVGGQPATTGTLTQTTASITVPSYVTGRVRAVTAYGQAESSQDLYVVPSGVTPSKVDSWATGSIDGGTQSLTVTAGTRSAVLAFDAQAGDRLSVQLDSYTANPSGSSLPYKLYSPTGALLYTNTLSNSTKTAHLPTIATTGRHLIVFTTNAGDAVSFSPRIESVLTLNTDGGTQIVSTTVAGQGKQYRFTANAGDTLSLATYNVVTTPTSVSNVEIKVNQPNGSQIDFTRGYRTHLPGDSRPQINLPATGTYSVYLEPAGLAAMSLNLRVVKPLNGTLTSGTPGAPVSAAIPLNGDIVWYAFTATVGQTLALNLSSIVTSPLGKTVRMEVYDSAGAQVANLSSVAPSTTLNLRSLAGGNYRVLVYPVYAETMTGLLTLADGVTTAVPADGTITPITTWVPGQIAYLTFPGTLGQNLSFATTGLTLTPSSGSVGLTVKRPNGTQQYFGYATRTNIPGDATTFFNLTATGTYTVTADPTEHTKGTYNLRVAPLVTGTIVPGDPVQNLSLPVQGDAGWMEFSIAAPRNVTVNVTSIVTTPANKTVRVEVFNTSGTSIGSNQGTGATRTVTLTNLAAGTYRVHIVPLSAATATMQVRIP
jgi:YD repeat-containing protein